MSNLIAIAYPEEDTAVQVATTLKELQIEHTIQLDDLVIAVRSPGGKIKLRQSSSTTGAGAAGGALWGGLIGLIFFAPLLGMAIGAASGAVAGKLTDSGVDDNFMKNLAANLEPGKAALILLVRQANTDKLLAEVKIPGEVIQSSLQSDTEQALKDALAAAGSAS